MNANPIAASALGLIFFFSMVACQKEEASKRGPFPVRSTDADLGHGYVRRDGAIHFIGGGVTGTGADATRIDTPSPRLLRKVVMSKFGSFKTAEGLDVDSFEVLCEEYTRDKNRVYYKVISNDEFIVIVLPDVDIDSSQYQQWTQANKTERIENELSALKNILDEKQLARYREHLEAEPPR